MTHQNDPVSPQAAPGTTISPLVGVYPARGLAFVRRVQTEETYRGGVILVTPKSRDKIAECQFEVVSLGNYEICEDQDECPLSWHTKKGEHRHRLQQGDWVLARLRSWMNTLDPAIYVVRQADILGVFREEE